VDVCDQFIGIVRNGKFERVFPQRPLGVSVGLTGIQMQEAVPPESAELDLTGYEGQAIMVCGYDGGGWIYAARVVDQAGPILTAVVQQAFGQDITLR
jgi:hypothetical protein